MDIQKLKKRLLREELRRRRKNSKKRRILISGVLLLLILLFGGGLFYVSNLDKTLEQEYARAEILVEKGDYETAVATFQDIYDRHPNFHLSAQALFQSAEVLNLYLKQYPEALLAYLLVIKDYPGSEPAQRAQLQEAEIYKNRLRDYGRAIIAYQKLLGRGVQNPDRIQYEVADSYFRLENFEQARIEFETLARNHPDSPLLPEVYYRIAVTLSLEGNLQEAEKGFRRVIDEWPEHPYGIEARFSLAGVLEDREELKASLEILEHLAEIYPNRDVLARKTDQVRERLRKKRGI